MKSLDNKIFIINSKTENSSEYEFVERKGKAHPDTLSDALAEELSRVYSNYTLSNFGAILHHNFDKVGLLGGQSSVKFGEGYLTQPIRVLINGRASVRFAGKKIPVKNMLEKTARDFLMKHFPKINREKDIEIHYNLSNASSPGKVDENASKEGTRKYWFEPRGLHDLRELRHLGSNDTSLGCSFAPLSKTENLVLQIENYLNSSEYKKNNPWIGGDIKIMASRIGNDIDITICIPQIADFVPNVQSYRENMEKARKDIMNLVKKLVPKMKVSLSLNTRDDFEACELYLTAIGSSIESGDEGLVGRGNRINGLITPCNPMCMEGACGKNPVYHVGKIYNLAADRIAKRIHEMTGSKVEVYLISQSGRTLIDPWKTVVVLKKNGVDSDKVLKLVQEELKRIPSITDSVIKGEVGLF